MVAYDAEQANPLIGPPADRQVYTWTSAVINAGSTRGSGANIQIPASTDGSAVVLAVDADNTLYTSAATVNLSVPVIWSGNFKPRGILQDAESYDVGGAAAGAWPTAEGLCDRLRIAPFYGDAVG